MGNELVYKQDFKFYIESDESISDIVSNLEDIGLKWCGYNDTLLDEFNVYNVTKSKYNFYVIECLCTVSTYSNNLIDICEDIKNTFKGGNSISGIDNNIIKYKLIEINKI